MEDEERRNSSDKTFMTAEPELLRQARAGNQLAFRKLVEQHEQQVRATVFGMLGDRPEAVDVAQEVFIRFYKSINNFKGDASLGTYLTRIAINLSLNELKRRKRSTWLTFFKGDEEKEIQIEDTNANPERTDTREMVNKALQLLDPDFRAVVVLRMIDGYSVKETAVMLDLPEGTVASRLARGQKKLKEILEKWM